MRHSVLVTLIFLLAFSAYPVTATAPDRQNVSVPLLAVDKQGQPVKNLAPGDLTVTVNGVPIDGFRVIPRSGSEKNVPKNVPGTLYLIFDTALSSRRSTELSRDTARQIIKNAKPGTRIVLLSIDGFRGLGYLGDAKDKPGQLLKLLDTRIKNDNQYDALNKKPDRGGNIFYEYDTTLYRRKCSGFAKAFESLYYLFHTVEPGANREIILFSEGISKERGGITSRQAKDKTSAFYAHYTRKTAGYLAHCGAVVTVVNPLEPIDSGSDQAENDEQNAGATGGPSSATQSLFYITKATRGHYVEGTPLKITKELQAMNEGCHTVTLAIPLKFQGPFHENTSCRLSITPKNKNISVHVQNTIERIKPYSLRPSGQQRFLALNLIAGHSLFRKDRRVHDLKAEKVATHKEKITVHFTLPEHLLNRRLDLLRIWLDENNTFMSMNREGVKYGSANVKIKSKTIEGVRPYLVLIDPKNPESAVFGNNELAGFSPAYVFPVSSFPVPMPDHISSNLNALGPSPDLLGTISAEPQNSGKTAAANDTQVNKDQLKRILNGAAGYCRQMKRSALHFVCDENIWLSFKPKRRKKKVLSKTYLCQYQLISFKGKVKERRRLYNKDGLTVTKNTIGTNNVPFLSRRVFFGPIALLSRAHQPAFKYRFLGYEYDKKKRRTLAVVEAFPYDEKGSANTAADAYSPYKSTVYGKVWIDTSDFSVVKILANPRSILSDKAIKALQEKFNGVLSLWVEAEFDSKYRELRFPSKVTILERYHRPRVKYRWWKGKYREIQVKPRESDYWRRSLTVYNYKDYRFFSVDTDVIYD